MRRNKIIDLAVLGTKVVFVITILVFLFIVGIVVHLHINKPFYDNVYLANGFQAGLNSFNLVLSNKNLTNIALSELSNSTIYWLLIRNGAILILVLSIQKLIIDVLHSMGNLQTFYDQNIRIFRRVATFSLVLAGISFFNFGTANGVTTWNFTIPFQPLLFSSAFFVLAEVFGEGKQLLEDSNLMV